MQEESKIEINECKRLITEINTRINKAIANDDSYIETDRETLRNIRNENINTFLLIQKYEMEGKI